MKTDPAPLPQVKPCPRQWEDMTGDGKRRFCEHCQLHVHNLSAMNAGERTALLAASSGRACITYEVTAAGTMRTATRWDRLTSPLRRLVRFWPVLAAVVPVSLSSCKSQRTLGAPLPPGGTTAVPDGGNEGRLLGEYLPDTERVLGRPRSPDGQ